MWKHPIVETVGGISLGAIAGALSRYYVGLGFTQLFGESFPYGTLFINVTGCLVMGFFATFSLTRVTTIRPTVRLMVTTGFLGSYTTFSSYTLDAMKLLQHNLENAVFYWGGTVVLGLISLQLGIALAEMIHPQTNRDESES